MGIKVDTNQPLKNFTYGRKFVRGLASRSIVPVILLEACVEGGRTYQAYKRGGFTEARERLTEEMIGAAFWFSGVPLFSKLIDKYIGKKVFKLPETDFHTGKDSLRDPVKNYIHKYKSQFQKHLKENPEKTIAKYKFGKVMASILLANCLVGIVLPKFNQGITKYLMKKKPEEKAENKPVTQKKYTMDEFAKKDNTNISFGAINPQTLMSLAYSFENNPKYGLVSTDAGVWVGRGACARNKYERTEVLFRDMSSTYFYMFNMPIIAALLNKIQDGKSTRLDPVGAQQVTEHLNSILDAHGGNMNKETFKEFVLGKAHNEAFITPSILEELNKNKGVMNVDKFIELLPEVKSKYPEIDIEKFTKAAKGMSKLQPKIADEAKISKKQILDIFSDGAINMPELLKKVFECSTSDQNLFTGKISEPTFDKEFTFISEKTFIKKQKEIADYVETIIKKAKDGKITKDLLKRVNRENYIKNAVNWGGGFAISAAFLSTFIPKIQYWITRKATGSNAFPGTADYSDKK